MRTLLILILFMPLVLKAQYIHEVLQYHPAPGQFINSTPWGHPSSATSITGGINGALSLGAFGGYVIFRFEKPVVNHPNNPYGIDFIIFGNPLPAFSEPGIVSVMKDENLNGLADDTWYELAGSDYFFSTSRQNYSVTYTSPGGTVASDVPWTDSLGEEGFIYAKTFHTQPYYPSATLFPQIPSDKFIVRGTRIAGSIYTTAQGEVISARRLFGYCDNRPRKEAPWDVPSDPYSMEITNAGGDGFDIHWAVDTQGNYVDLQQIDFVKVHTAVLGDAAWLGEFSTEITGAIATVASSLPSSDREFIVINALPASITSSPFQLEAMVFENGRARKDKSIIWSTDTEGAAITDDGLLSFSSNGKINIKATSADNPQVFAITTASADLSTGISDETLFDSKKPIVSPNPTMGVFTITAPGNNELNLYNLQGELINNVAGSRSYTFDITKYPVGMYLLRITTDGRTEYIKIVKY